jgi:HK97 gp10 family phage protein
MKKDSLIGLTALSARFEMLDESVKGEIASRATEAMAEETRMLASANAPVRTGKLRSDITIGEEEREEGKTFRKVGITKDAFYGLFQEFGAGNSPAQPFLRPALESPTVIEAAKNELKKGLGK